MKRYLLCVVLVTQLFACASVDSLKQKALPIASHSHVESILAVKQWRLLGRLSVRNTKESWLTKLEWRHNELIDGLILSTSLGGVVAKLEYSDSVIALSNIEGETRLVSEQELRELLGYSPPLSHLKFWVRGVANPRFTVQVMPSPSLHVKAFEQDGWQVSLSKFHREGGLVLPSKVSLEKEGLKIKLVVDQWLM